MLPRYAQSWGGVLDLVINDFRATNKCNEVWVDFDTHHKAIRVRQHGGTKDHVYEVLVLEKA